MICGYGLRDLRGRKQIPYPEARRRSRKSVDPKDKGLRIGGVTVPSFYKYRGFFFMGEQGSGKSLSVMLLMLQAFLEDRNSIGVVHDYKMELHAFLRWAGIPRSEIAMLNPYDIHCWWWDVQSDCLDSETAFEIACALCPKQPDEKQPFFIDSARLLLRDVIRFFVFRAREEPYYTWKLRDVFNATRDKKTMEQMFLRYPELSASITFLNRENNDVLTTLYSHIDKLTSIAALWAERPKSKALSFRRWKRKGKPRILILGNDPTRETQIQTINAVMWEQLSKAVLDPTAPREKDTWLFLDELHAMNQLPNLSRFANTVRSAKGCLVLSTQDINQLYSTYGREITNSVLQGCATMSFLRCSGDAAAWAAQFIGIEEIRKKGDGGRIGGNGVSIDWNEKTEDNKTILKEEIAKLLPCTPENGMSGVYVIPTISDVYRYTMPFEEFKAVWPDKQIEPDYEPEDELRKYDLKPWSDEERKRILYGLDKEPPLVMPERDPEEDRKADPTPSNVKPFVPRRRQKRHH